MAETKSQLALALSKAQGEMKSAKKDSTNPFYKAKYADLSSVWEACRDVLAKNEIAVLQSPEIKDGVLVLRTKIIHSSGEFEEGCFPIAAAITAKAQEMGSAITYARRYVLSSMVGVATEDDDGNEAQNTNQKAVDYEKFSKDYAAELDLADTKEKLDVLVKRNSKEFSDLSKKFPKWYTELSSRINKKYGEFDNAKAV